MFHRYCFTTSGSLLLTEGDCLNSSLSCTLKSRTSKSEFSSPTFSTSTVLSSNLSPFSGQYTAHFGLPSSDGLKSKVCQKFIKVIVRNIKLEEYFKIQIASSKFTDKYACNLTITITISLLNRLKSFRLQT